MKIVDSIKIKIPSLRENIRIVESFIENAEKRFRISDDIYGNIMVAVTEAVNNAITHGNKEEEHKNVMLSLFLENNAIHFEVKDEGKGFDYHNLPDPTLPENVEKLYGRGVFLMRKLSDEVRFEDNGRLVVLTFYMT